MGINIAELARSSHSDHVKLVECSNMGICDRDTGNCKCYPPFTGSACNLSKYPGMGGSMIESYICV